MATTQQNIALGLFSYFLTILIMPIIRATFQKTQ